MDAERERSRGRVSNPVSPPSPVKGQKPEHAEAERQRTVAARNFQKTIAQTQRAVADRAASSRCANFDSASSPSTFMTRLRFCPDPLPRARWWLKPASRYCRLAPASEDLWQSRGLEEEIARGYDRLGDAQGNPYYANRGGIATALWRVIARPKALRARISDPSAEFLADRIQGSVRISQILTQKGDLQASSKVLTDALKVADGAPAAGDYGVQQALARAWTALGDLKSSDRGLCPIA